MWVGQRSGRPRETSACALDQAGEVQGTRTPEEPPSPRRSRSLLHAHTLSQLSWSELSVQVQAQVQVPVGQGRGGPPGRGS